MHRPAALEFVNSLRYPPHSPLKWKVVLSALEKRIPMTDSPWIVNAASQFVNEYGRVGAICAVSAGLGWWIGAGGDLSML